MNTIKEMKISKNEKRILRKILNDLRKKDPDKQRGICIYLNDLMLDGFKRRNLLNKLFWHITEHYSNLYFTVDDENSNRGYWFKNNFNRMLFISKILDL